MIRNETFLPDGTLVAAEIIDLDAGTYTRDEYGTIVATRPLAADEIATYAPAPDPRADLIAQVEQATTVAKLRAAVLAALDSGAI